MIIVFPYTHKAAPDAVVSVETIPVLADVNQTQTVNIAKNILEKSPQPIEKNAVLCYNVSCSIVQFWASGKNLEN